MDRKKALSTFDVASLLGVYHKTVSNWVDTGKLAAYTTPGGHRRINEEDLLRFLEEFNMPVPPRLLGRQKPVILIVDDEEAIQRLIIRAIKTRELDYEIHTVSDGFAAGRMYMKVEPDLIIMDIKLPGLDGITVCRTIREDNTSVKIIAITGYDFQGNKKRMLQAGADAFHQKPLDLIKLVDEIEQLLGASNQKHYALRS